MRLSDEPLSYDEKVEKLLIEITNLKNRVYNLEWFIQNNIKDGKDDSRQQ